MGDDPLIGYSTATVRFERLLGKGAMGAVYCGVQLSLQRPVAIKVIANHLTEDPAYLARFEREAHTLGRLVHPHVIACHDFGPSPGPDGKPIYLMVMEFVDGWSLGWLSKNKRVTVRSVLELHRQAADGLAAAHALGIVHRDIKPDNILVTRAGQAKIADFGLARELSQASDLTAAGSILGSPGFMSPETCRGLEPTAASDIYSLGCSLVQVLSGAPVYANTSALAVMQMHISEAVPRLADRRPELAGLQEVVDRCLAKDPAQRYPGAQALSRALAERITTYSRALVAGRQVQGGATPAAGGSSRLPTAGVTLGTHLPGTAAGAATLSTSYPARRAIPRKSHARMIIIIAACVLTPVVLALIISNRPGTAPASPSAERADQEPTAPAPALVPPGGTSRAAQAPHAVSPSPTTPAIDPDAADREQLARIDLLVDRNELDQAESALEDLVVTGELKQVRKAVLEKLDHAWIRQGGEISAELDAAKALIASDPKGAVARLRALSIPEHFNDLDDTRQQLIAKAEHTAPADNPAATAPGARSALATHVTAGGYGRPGHFGSDEVPGPQPYGKTFFLSSLERISARSGDAAYIIIRLPPGTDKDGFAALVHCKGTTTLYVREMLDGRREGGPRIDIPLSGKDWELIRIPLTLSTTAGRSVILAMPFKDGPFWFAGAALGHGGMPSWDGMQIVPGTLTSGSAENLPLALLRSKHANFPQFPQIRLAMPDGCKGERAHALIARLYQACGLDISHGPPDWAQTHQAFYAEGNDRYALLDQLGDAHASTSIAIAAHVLSTAHPPSFRPGDVAPALLSAMHDERNPVLPVLVFTADATSPEAHTPWATFERQLRELVPGVPMIDLNLAIIDSRRLGGNLEPGGAHWIETCDLGFQGGFAELIARLREK